MSDRFKYMDRNPIDRIDNAIDAIHAVNWMLYHTLSQGDEVSMIANGIHRLLELQCWELDQSLTEICEKNEASKTVIGSMLAPSTQRKIEEAEAEEEAEEAVVGDIRRTMILDSIAKGATAADVAKAMGLNRSAVDRVAAQLKGGASKSDVKSGKEDAA